MHSSACRRWLAAILLCGVIASSLITDEPSAVAAAANAAPDTAATAAGSTAGPTKGAAAISDDDVPAGGVNKRAEVARRLADVEKAIAGFASRKPPQAAPEQLVSERELLRLLQLTLDQQQTAAGELRELAAEQQSLEEQLAALRRIGPSEARPFTFSLLEELRDQLSSERQRRSLITSELAAAQQIRELTEQTHAETETRRRQLQEKLAATAEVEARSQLQREFTLIEIYGEVTGATMQLRELERKSLERKAQINSTQLAYLEEKVAIVEKDARFTPQDLQTQLSALSQRETELRQQLETVQADLRQSEQRWEEARQKLAQASATDSTQAHESVTWELVVLARRAEISLVNQQLRAIVVSRFWWNNRFKAANHQATADELFTWRSNIESFIERCASAQKLLESQLNERRQQLVEVERQLRSAQKNKAPSLPWLEHQIRELQRLQGIYGWHLSAWQADCRSLENFRDELEKVTRPRTLAGLRDRAQRSLTDVWCYELTAVDDRPITVGKILSGCLLLVVGYMLSRLISRFIALRLLPRVGINPGASVALQSVSFYLLLTIFGFLSLELVNVPLTVFTFLGGAVAIGVGFGSQNVVNNFISGLILMVERPIRIGDLVSIDGVYGTVEHLGARSTRVRTGSNMEIIVPNSRFLENNVTNWTLTDTRVRTSVSVGVDYESPTRLVAQLLLQSVRSHEQVLPTPDPIVLFQNFGDNSLEFEVHFWVQMRTMMESRLVESEIRFRVNELFREHGISISFPQRDVHLDTLRPLEVNIRSLEAGKQSNRLRSAA